MDDIKFFEKYLTEAPGDETDTVEEVDINEPPSVDNIDEVEEFSGDPPEVDINFGEEDIDYSSTEDTSGTDETENIEGLDNKVSAILNQQLYQKYLKLISDIGNQLTLIKNNSDILLSINKEITKVEESYRKLNENIRLYLRYNFLTESYSKNLLFFNKCINLHALLNKSFDTNINSGIKNME